MNAAEYILEVIASYGVRHLFAIPGKGNLGFYDAMAARRDRVRHVLAKHEQGAAYMADGYARSGAAPFGVCLGISGGAAINLMGGAFSATADSVPMLVLTGNAPTTTFGRNAMMEFSGVGRRPDPATLFAPITKFSAMVGSAKDVPDTLADALAAALHDRPGAVHVCVPFDVQLAAVGTDHIPPPIVPSASRPDPERIAEAATALGAARNPVILAGWGAVRAGARSEILALAEALGAPVVTTLKGKGAVPGNHPLCVGHVALARSPAAERVVKSPDVDVVLAVGTTLSEWTNFAWSPEFLPKAQLVQLDVDPSEISRVYPVKVAVVGDARASLAGVREALRPDAGVVAERRRAVQRLVREAGPFDAPDTRLDERVPLRPQAVVTRLAARLPDGVELLTDAGNHTFFTSHYYPLKSDDSFYMGGGSAAMGWSVAASIGVKLARPERLVVDVTGDGGFLMNGVEVETAVSHDAPVLWVVFTDRALGMVKTFQTLFRGKDYLGSEFGDIDPARVAQGLGAHGRRIERLDELDDALGSFLGAPTPTVLDVRIDGSEVPPGIMDRLGK